MYTDPVDMPMPKSQLPPVLGSDTHGYPQITASQPMPPQQLPMQQQQQSLLDLKATEIRADHRGDNEKH